MDNIWKNNNDGSYSFLMNGKNYGEFKGASSGRADITTEQNQYTILRQGFWKNNIVILDTDANEVLAIKPIKWYGSSYSITYNNKNHILKIGNNPLSEWSIYDGSVLLLAYALHAADGKTALKISEFSGCAVLFHFLLWYLIRPILEENSSLSTEILLLNNVTMQY